jgi:uncharacterized membrane protein
MEELFREVASYIALGLEAVAVVIIVYGAGVAMAGLFQRNPDTLRPFAGKKRVYMSFGVWLLLGLEFELAADIVRTAISPTWGQIGELAAIAVIRTFLNYFLERDVEKYAEEKNPTTRSPHRGNQAGEGGR